MWKENFEQRKYYLCIYRKKASLKKKFLSVDRQRDKNIISAMSNCHGAENLTVRKQEAQ